jgi:ArsR family transcriptional regulator
MSRLRADVESGRDRARRSVGPIRRDEELARLARALGHPARAAILRALRGSGACSCGEIVNLLPLAQATVSQHLKVLKEAGLAAGEIDGPRVCYGPNPRTVERFKELIRGL